MSLIFVDGSDDGLGASKYNTQYTSITIVAGRNGNGMQYGSNNAGITKRRLAVADEHATMTIGTAWRSAGNTESFTQASTALGNIITFQSDDGATSHISVGITDNANLRVSRGAIGGVNLGLYPFVPQLGLWYYFEVKMTLSDTVGAVEVKMNGTTVINLNNVDTKNAGTKTVIDTIARQSSTGNSGVYIVDDQYVCNGAGSINNSFLGDIAIETLYPNGNGFASDFAGSDGNSVDNYLLVDEAGTVVTTDYTQSGATNARDLYAMQNMVRSGGTVKGVVATAVVLNTDSGAQSVGVDVRSASTNYDGPSIAVTTTQSIAQRVLETDPATGTAWTVPNVNALEVGVSVG